MKNRKTINISMVLIICVLFMSDISALDIDRQNDMSCDVLFFDKDNFEVQEITLDETTIKVRTYENIVYVANPVDTIHQKMNIYIPIEYFKGENIEGYSSTIAPIFFPNSVGGYMPAKPCKFIESKTRRNNTVAMALSKGYIVASPEAWGSTSLRAKHLLPLLT